MCIRDRKKTDTRTQLDIHGRRQTHGHSWTYMEEDRHMDTARHTQKETDTRTQLDIHRRRQTHGHSYTYIEEHMHINRHTDRQRR